MEFLAFVVFVTLLVSIGWTHFWGAPWVPTSRPMVRSMLALAEVQPGDVVYDLGCGDGRVIITAAKQFGAQAVGIEVDPLRYLWCQLLITVLGLRGRVRVILGDLFSQDLSNADVVTCYLLQDTNQKLAVKLLGELRPGARVVSNTFTFAGIEPVREHGPARLYVFHPEPESPTA
jgi:predicted RNA methylase